MSKYSELADNIEGLYVTDMTSLAYEAAVFLRELEAERDRLKEALQGCREEALKDFPNEYVILQITHDALAGSTPDE